MGTCFPAVCMAAPRRWCACLIFAFALLVSLALLRPPGASPSLRLVEGVNWQNAPRIDLVCRTYGAAIQIFWQTFIPTYLMFWPISSWKSSGLVVILDGDSAFDHRIGTLLQNINLPSKVQVKYETPAPPGTLCNNWRSEGYARQQYSNFYADLYTDADYMGIIDTDAAFISPVVPSDLFDGGKPILRGMNIITQWQSETSRNATGGFPYVGRFMTRIAFPIIIKSEHFSQMRQVITENLGAETFEEAFKVICSAGKESYSQFEIMINYLWYYHHDEYSWHIADRDTGNFHGLNLQGRARASDDGSVVAANVPAIFAMKHLDDKDVFTLNDDMYENVCLGSNNEAGNCQRRPPAQNDGHAQTLKWSVGSTTWGDTYKEHSRQVSRAGSAFQWRGEEDEDWVHVGGQ
ncbi:unnamed protein product [Ectocarpus sp. 6 AP-2014]